MQLRLRNRVLDLSMPRIMGVLNRTPDSFSDGGRYLDIDKALAQAGRMVDEGADLIDVGGESTRPGADPVGEQQELDRVVPLIERLRDEVDCVLSVDTSKPAVMRAACAAGADLINDVNALRANGAVAAAADTGAAVCLMHMQGEPRTMQQAPQYADVVAEVRDFLGRRVIDCVDAGIPRERLCVDPGFGFGKNLGHNLALLAGLDTLSTLGLPVLVGFSRKSMLGAIAGRSTPDARLTAGIATAALAVSRGALIVRTHDVAETRDAVRVAWVVRQAATESMENERA